MCGLLETYRGLTGAAKPLLSLLLSHRRRRGKEDAARIGERRGMAARPRPAGPLIWLHAASVGESQSALTLLDGIGKATDGKVRVLVTTGTVTSAELMAQRLPDFAFHQYVPLDQPSWTQKFLNHWKPDAAFWIESELWPNLLTELKARGVPCILVNARLSEKSFRGWRRVPALAREILDCFNLILTQTDVDGERFLALGAKNVRASDNIKYSAAPLPYNDIALSALKLCTEGRPVWVYASTHAGEETLACRLHKNLRETLPNLLTIIVPRHPARRDEIAGVCFEEGVKFRLRGETNVLPTPEDDIYIADTLGELGLFYALCPVAVIGRSFSNDGGGGHNPLEAALLGCAVVTGPNNQFQRQIYDEMAAAGAVIETNDAQELESTLLDLLTNAEKCEQLRAKGHAFADRKAHVIDTVMKEVMPFLNAMGERDAA